MRVLLAPDKFKGSLSAAEAAAAMAEGVLQVYPDAVTTLLPVADGGEGTLEAALSAGYTEHGATVHGPLQRNITAAWALSPDGRTAVIETARACGLMLVEPSVPTALAAHSYGAGELILAALDAGATEIVLGIGGSAMTDAGAGALRALGLRVYDDAGAEVPLGGAGLGLAARLDASGLDPRLATAVLRIAADVRNPLTGPDGAAEVFGGQKGADARARRLLDDALAHYAGLLTAATGRDVDVPGAGAAGGFPASFLAFTAAALEPGFEVVARFSGLDEALAATDLVLTGEGSLDEQSTYGKAPLALAALAHRAGIPVVVIAGRCTLAPDRLAGYGIVGAVSLLDLAPTPGQAMAQAGKYVTLATRHALEGA